MEGALLPFTEYEPGPRPCTPPVSPRGSQDPPTCAPVQVGPGKQGADLPSFLCLGPCTPAGNSDPPLKLLVILGRHTRVAHTPVATCPAAWVLLHPPVCTHRHGACFVRHETVPSLTHTPHHHVCTHVPGARVRGRVKNTRSPLAACSDSPSALTAPERRTCGGSGGHMCAHVQAQTVHTCASHEKMFISYMDVQRLHHYMCTEWRGHKESVGAWALPSLCVTLSKLHPLPQFLPGPARELGLMPSR